MAVLLEYLILRHRWLLVLLFLLPLSVVYDAFYYLRCKLLFYLRTSPEAHDKRVRRIQKQVREWQSTDGSRPMCTARPGWQTMSFRRGLYKHTHYCIDLTLLDILNIDREKRVIRVEPLVTMGQITATLNPLGWTLPIVPELDDLTVGGLINGCGIETSSHIYGLFQHICTSFEIVLADGSLVHCNKEENSDLFYSIPWSHGTLAFLVAAELRIVPAKKFVKLKYIPSYSQEETVAIFTKETENKDNDFVEGIVFSKNTAVIMSATMTDTCQSTKVNAIGRFYKPWFFSHVETYLTKGTGVEYVPLRDYHHRHSRSIFWEIRDVIPFGNNPLFRWLCGWMVPPKVSLLKLTQTQTIKDFYERYQMIQDILVPLKHLLESLKFFDEKITMYPLWLCPFVLPNQPGMVHPEREGAEMYVDIGAYGVPTAADYHPRNTTRSLEAFARKLHGFQMLYADTYMTRKEFLEMFDHRLYDKLRKTLRCEKAFPHVYDKINRTARY